MPTNPIRRISHHSIDALDRRQNLSAIAQDKRGVAYDFGAELQSITRKAMKAATMAKLVRKMRTMLPRAFMLHLLRAG